MQLALYGKEIWLFQSAIDFRSSIDGLLRLIIREAKNPQEGVYLFYNKRGDKLKGLCWHKNGYLLFYKRLEQGRFSVHTRSHHCQLTQEECGWLLAGLEWEKMREWGELSYQKFS
jgi:transposase